MEPVVVTEISAHFHFGILVADRVDIPFIMHLRKSRCMHSNPKPGRRPTASLRARTSGEIGFFLSHMSEVLSGDPRGTISYLRLCLLPGHILSKYTPGMDRHRARFVWRYIPVCLFGSSLLSIRNIGASVVLFVIDAKS